MPAKEYYKKINILKEEILSAFIGSPKILDRLLTGFLSGLHVLIDDIPGVGKTTLAKALAKSSGMDFARIQFTPDLLPGDIIGMSIWSIEKKEFVFKSGAIMHQFVLADEINRASARTQSSLLEAMQEETVTVDGRTYELPKPFFVIATQNPVTFSGTFQLPEAQLDRFGISFSIGYPDEDHEISIIDKYKSSNPVDKIKSVITPDEIIKIREYCSNIHVNENIKKYIVQIVNQTRNNEKIKLGLSPRSALHMIKASQAQALLSSRDFVIPEDVINIAEITVCHKLILSSKARMDNLNAQQIIDSLIKTVQKPSGI